MTKNDTGGAIKYGVDLWLEHASEVLDECPDPRRDGPEVFAEWLNTSYELNDIQIAAVEGLRVVFALHGPTTPAGDPTAAPHCAQCKDSHGNPEAFPCLTYRKVSRATAGFPTHGAPRSAAESKNPERRYVEAGGDGPSDNLPKPAQVTAENRITAWRLPDGGIEFSDGTRWGGERYPDRDSIRTDLERLERVDELMRIEEADVRIDHMNRVAVAMFGDEYGCLVESKRSAVDEAMHLIKVS